MGAITVANKDWAVVEDVADALAGATIGGSVVFPAVSVTTAKAQLREVQLAGQQPRALIRYVGSTHTDLPEDVRSTAVELEISLAARVAPDADQRGRLEEALRLVNAAINAIEADPPDDATGVADGKTHRPALQWGRPDIDADEAAPWAVARLPLTINLVLGNDGRH